MSSLNKVKTLEYYVHFFQKYCCNDFKPCITKNKKRLQNLVSFPIKLLSDDKVIALYIYGARGPHIRTHQPVR